MLRLGLLVLAGLPLFAGCGGNDRPKLAPVSGEVTFKGEPLAEGTIVFLPENGRAATGKIVDGEITEVTTFDPNDGAQIGKHTVTVMAVTNSDSEDMQAERKSLIPLKYANPEKSGLSATVEAGGSNSVKIILDEK